MADLPAGYGVKDADLSTAQDLLGTLHADISEKKSPEDFSPRRWQVRTKLLLVDQVFHRLEPH